MKILIAVDGSPQTRRMLAWLAASGHWLAAPNEIGVLHVVLPLPHRAAAFAGPQAVHGYYEEDAEAVLRPIRAFLEQQGCHASYAHHVGHPAEVIVRTAEEGRYDIVVMGSHGHGAVGNLLLGSIATRVLSQSGPPVLVVR